MTFSPNTEDFLAIAGEVNGRDDLVNECEAENNRKERIAGKYAYGTNQTYNPEWSLSKRGAWRAMHDERTLEAMNKD